MKVAKGEKNYRVEFADGTILELDAGGGTRPPGVRIVRCPHCRQRYHIHRPDGSVERIEFACMVTGCAFVGIATAEPM